MTAVASEANNHFRWMNLTSGYQQKHIKKYMVRDFEAKHKEQLSNHMQGPTEVKSA